LGTALVLAAHAQPPVKHVLVIGYDGMSPRGLQTAKAPVIGRVREQGAYTWHARGVMPTSSSPNWASMIMGAGPEQHGVTSNDWMPDKFDIEPTVKGPGGIFPTIFGKLRQQEPSAVIAIFHEWEGFARLVEAGVCNRVDHPGTRDADETVRRAAAYIPEHQPRLTFIHLDLVDHAGHKFGHGSPEYIAAIEKADRLTGLILDAVEKAGMMPDTLVLLSADHGGLGKKHGGATMAEIEIPWIVRGPGVAPGRELRGPVNTWDTAATLAYVLGVKAPAGWIGKPVMEAFGPRAR
jgi:predicted AlkP superfamily pyrophosphatase or phosphodiesterase